MNLKKDAQVPVSIALRTAIWNWIELCPEEFNEALLSHRRLEGAPERVYDLLFDLQENTRDKAGAWPTLAVLLSISYDRMKNEYETNAIGAHKTNYRKVKSDHALGGPPQLTQTRHRNATSRSFSSETCRTARSTPKSAWSVLSMFAEQRPDSDHQKGSLTSLSFQPPSTLHMSLR